jgi:hypothetical protein
MFIRLTIHLLSLEKDMAAEEEILKCTILMEKWKYILPFYKMNLLCERNP